MAATRAMRLQLSVLREQLQKENREGDHKGETAAIANDRNHENFPETNTTETQTTAMDSALDSAVLPSLVNAVLLTKSTQTVPIELHSPSRAQSDASAVEEASTALRAKMTEMQSKHARVVAAHCARTDEADGRTNQQKQKAMAALADAADAKKANAALCAEITELKTKHARIVAAHSAATAEAHRLSHRLLTHVELDAYSHTQTMSNGVNKGVSQNGGETRHRTPPRR
jgi:hypothetical protein